MNGLFRLAHHWVHRGEHIMSNDAGQSGCDPGSLELAAGNRASRPRFRVTIRRLMVAVAIVAIAGGTTVAYVRSGRRHDLSITAARAVYTANEPDVSSLIFSDDGTILAAAGSRGSIQLWHTSTTWAMASTTSSGAISIKSQFRPTASGWPLQTAV